MGTSVLFKKISPTLIVMEVIGDGFARQENNNIFNNFVGNRNKQQFIYEYHKVPNLRHKSILKNCTSRYIRGTLGKLTKSLYV